MFHAILSHYRERRGAASPPDGLGEDGHQEGEVKEAKRRSWYLTDGPQGHSVMFGGVEEISHTKVRLCL